MRERRCVMIWVDEGQGLLTFPYGGRCRLKETLYGERLQALRDRLWDDFRRNDA